MQNRTFHDVRDTCRFTPVVRSTPHCLPPPPCDVTTDALRSLIRAERSILHSIDITYPQSAASCTVHFREGGAARVEVLEDDQVLCLG